MYLNPEPAEKPVFDALWARGLPLTVKRFEDPRPARSSESAGQLWAVKVALRPIPQTRVDSALPGVHLAMMGTQAGVGPVVPTYIEVQPLQCVTWSREAMAGTGRSHRHGPSCEVTAMETAMNYAPIGWWIKRQWDFVDAVDGLLGAMRWDPETEPEPQGWVACGDRIRPRGVAYDEYTPDPPPPDPIVLDDGTTLVPRPLGVGWQIECPWCIWKQKYLSGELAMAGVREHIEDHHKTQAGRWARTVRPVGTPIPATVNRPGHLPHLNMPSNYVKSVSEFAFGTDTGRVPEVGDMITVNIGSGAHPRIITEVKRDAPTPVSRWIRR